MQYKGTASDPLLERLRPFLISDRADLRPEPSTFSPNSEIQACLESFHDAVVRILVT